MRFKSAYALKSDEGRVKVVRKFLLFPRQIGDSDWRWLETADIVMRVDKVNASGSWDIVYGWKWREVGFADEEKT